MELLTNLQRQPNAALALSRYDVTLQQVEDALKKNNLNTSGGYAIQGDKEKPIRVFGRLGPERHLVLSDLEKIAAGKAGSAPTKARRDRFVKAMSGV